MQSVDIKLKGPQVEPCGVPYETPVSSDEKSPIDTKRFVS